MLDISVPRPPVHNLAGRLVSPQLDNRLGQFIDCDRVPRAHVEDPVPLWLIGFRVGV